MNRNGCFRVLVVLIFFVLICFTFWTSRHDVHVSFVDVKTPKTAAPPYTLANVTSQQLLESRKFPSTKQVLVHPFIADEKISIYDERRELARNMCQSYRNVNEWKQFVPTGKIWSYGYPEGIHYCIVPKVGCTYWKKIFRFLNKAIPQDKNITKPSDIPRQFVHYGGTQTIPITDIKDRVSTQLLSGRKFMFSRDPYSRLWSAYIDKFHLPDFWRTQAINAMKLARHNASQAEIACPKNITFHEFLLFVTGSKNWNEHWEPIYRICSPCHVNYDIIGHQETFANDAKYILNRYGHENLIEEVESNTRVKEETSMLIEYNFNLEGAIRKGCFEKLDVAKRLWTAFQYNGYVHKDTEFPNTMNMTLFNKNPIRELSKQLDIVLENQITNGVKLKTQKLEFMSKAYKTIPKEVLQKVKDVFRFDFELFGYKLEPVEIFGKRS